MPNHTVGRKFWLQNPGTLCHEALIRFIVRLISLMGKILKPSCRRWFLSLRRRSSLSLVSFFLVGVIIYLIGIDVVKQHARHLSGVNWSLENLPRLQSHVFPTNCYEREKLLRMHWESGEKLEEFHNSIKDQWGQVCIHPSLDPCSAEIALYDQSVQKPNCSVEENWVYVDNGTFRISEKARKKHGKITCEYAPIVRGKGDYAARHAEHIKPMPDGSPLVSDFFKVACISPSGKRYHNIHAGVAYNETLHSRSKDTPLPSQALGYDVFMFGFDSTSRMSWMRNLQKTRHFFLNELQGVELEGYNIVGDGTVQALLPILAGNLEADLPSSRRDVPGSKEVDEYPWIWKEFKKAGYVTAWAEDMSHIGTFQMRLRGFREQPTDHSMRTYFMMAEPMSSKFKPWCAGSDLRHQRFLNWFKDMYHMYRDKRKFMFGFHSEYSHSDSNNLKMIDDDFYKFLRDLHSSGYLNHTILILMGDHGARFAKQRSTQQGKLEERLPYFAFRFPPGMYKSHPEALRNFHTNTKRLTSPFDIHETFHHILNFQANQMDHTKTRGISLFKEVPKERTCKDTGIEPHWCACLQWEKVEHELTSRLVSEAVIDFLNSLLSKVRSRCALLGVKEVLSLSRFSPNAQVLKFRESSDRHGDIPDLTDNMKLDTDYFQITLVTEPGQGRFEVTVKHYILTDQFQVSEKEISRTNRYGDDPKCIAEEYPSLRPYCYCS